MREVTNRLSQTAEGLASVSPILKLAADKDVKMPIVEQVLAVMEGRMEPRDIAPTLTHETDEPTSE
ncbi:unannotated protein [freshwater metagenome]|uniref:Unannotated protein n=1 Tax=freshwater metagenome TaxID=449393 RepID=A0A6J7G767_9ZZZZ